jgi:hypothetical protein
MPREQRPLIAIIVLLIAAAMALEIANGRFWLNDFRVYYSAADALIHGQQVYGLPFGEDTGFFKYAPMVAIAFVPAALLPFHIAAVIHFLFIGLALILCQVGLERVLMRHLFGTYPPRMVLRGILGLVIIAVLLARELHLGNINLWLVLGAVLATEALLNDAPGRAGLLLGALWFVKPYLLLMAVPVVVFGQWRALWYALLIMLAGLFTPILVLGHATTHALTHAWFEAMAAHSSYLQSPDTLAAMVSHWSGGRWHLNNGVVIVVGGVTIFLVSMGIRRSASVERPAAFALMLWIALALVPNLVITDQEHFLFSLPLIAFLMAKLFRGTSLIPLALFLVGTFLYSLRSSDLWGNDLEAWWTSQGALGIGNLLLICATLSALFPGSKLTADPAR